MKKLVQLLNYHGSIHSLQVRNSFGKESNKYNLAECLLDFLFDLLKT